MKVGGVVKIIFLLVMLFVNAGHSFTLICNGECPNLKGWEGEELAIELNATDCPSGITQEIEEAFNVWNQVSTAKLKLKLGGANNESVAVIVNRVATTPAVHAPVITCDAAFQTTFSLSADEVDGILGVGLAETVGGDTLNTGFIVLNTQPGAGGNIASQSAIQRKIVIAHELGHMLGIGHSAEFSALMFFNIGEKGNLRRHQDDADAYSYLYPKSEPGDGFLGCGSIHLPGGGNPPSSVSWLLLALPMIFWLRLRQSLTLTS